MTPLPKLTLPSPTAQAVAELAQETETAAQRQERLMSGLVALAALALFLGAPFALKAGSAFFLPLAAALVISLVLVPGLEWLERRGLPSGGAAMAVVTLFVLAANAILFSIVVPMVDWLQLLPQRVDRIRANLDPVLETWADLERFADQVTRVLGAETAAATAPAAVPGTLADLATAAPTALLSTLFTLLLVFFFLSTYTDVRRRVIDRQSSAARAIGLSRLTRDVIRATASYFFTIGTVNVALGAATALMAWALGLPTPLMWGGFAALLNFIPYVGPLVVALLLLVGGLIAFTSPLAAVVPAAVFVGFHVVEANYITPSLVGRRLTVSPLAILLALSFWGWVWGTVGALLSVPLLIMSKVFVQHVGTPDIMGFLFRDGSLLRGGDDR